MRMRDVDVLGQLLADYAGGTQAVGTETNPLELWVSVMVRELAWKFEGGKAVDIE
jgi:hypothetical protein